MSEYTLNNMINLFQEGKKCIINADLDGILSGMLLQKFLGWEVVGFSSCVGKSNDELWLFNEKENIKECVFIDLPVYLKDYLTIDQHFILFDKDSIKDYDDGNKINPNIIKNRVFKVENDKSQYTMKYPFGTVHFVLALLEKLGIIPDDYKFDFTKNLEGFDTADLILRADRVIGNTCLYTANCLDWTDWLIELGKSNTKELFNKVKTELPIRKLKEANVGKKMYELGCKSADGDCANMLRDKDYDKLRDYFNYLSSAFNMDPIPVKKIFDFNKLEGIRYKIEDYELDELKKKTLDGNIFSFAFVSMSVLSVTYINE